jgi:hypothetical protein
MDIKDYWGVDSSPGSAQDTTEKCGNLFATMGATGSATIAAYSTDLADRATVTPGSHPTINTGASPRLNGGTNAPSAAGAARGASLGFNAKGTTYFDSFAAMYGLSEFATGSDKLTISFWISPDDAAQGCILGSPFQSYNKLANNNTDPVNDDFSVFYNFNPVCGGGIAEAFHPDTTTARKFAIMGHVPSTGTITTPVTTKDEIDISLGVGTGMNATISDPSYTSGSDGLFYHVMIAIHTVSGQVKATIYVNDTAIITDTAISPDFSAFLTGETAKIPFGPVTGVTTYPALRDNAAQAVQPIVASPNVWHVGGRLIDFFHEWDTASPDELSVFPEGDGLYGAVTELWIAQGQYIDWSNSANRNKFHTTDILGNVFVPTNIGAHGETPTGTKPTMYFTGGPDQFVVNRVNGVTCNVYKGTRNSLTLDGRYPGAL